MRRFIFPAIAGLILLAGIAYAVYWFTTGRYIQSTDNAYVEADIAVVAPKVAGYVASVPVTDNQSVRRGDALLVIDDRDYRAAVARAAAEVDRLTRSVATARATATAGGSQIAEAQAQVVAARAEQDRSSADVRRYGTLYKERWVSKAALDVKVADAASRAAAVRQAESAVAAARAQLAAANASTGGAGSAVAGARAALESARLDLANTVVRAPIDGVVGNRSARPGQYARIGQQAMVVVPVQAVYVVANFKETQIGRMQPGQPVELTADAWKDTRLAGRILSFAPASGSRFSVLPPENATGNFTKIVQRVPVKVAIDSVPAGVRLVPGMSVQARIDVRDAAR